MTVQWNKEWQVVANILDPSVDIHEEQDCTTIVIDMPGVNERDIHVNLEDDILKVSAKSEDKDYYKEIILIKRFTNVMALHSYKNGILVVRLYMTWGKDMEIGVNEIDNQHKKMFSMVNNLISAMERGKGKEEVCNIYTFLENYIIEHFCTEEGLMIRHNYDEYSKMKTAHEQFKKDFSRLKKEFEAQGITSNLAGQTQQWLCDWLTNHIGNEDKKLGAFLKRKMIIGQ